MNTTTITNEIKTTEPAAHKRCIAFYIKRGLKWLAISILSILALGLVFQAVSVEFDKRAYQPLGQMVNVDGHLMHLYCTGQGSPTIILEAGAFSFSSEWYWVQKQLESTNRVCSYDRAGNGWSESVPGTRDGTAVVHDLHTLLQNAAVPAPYVLVGHSLGGVTNPMYTTQYPDEVLGLVLVDSAVPIALANPDKDAVQRYIAQNESAYVLLSVLARFGVLRFIISNEFNGYGYPPEIAAELTAFKSTNPAVDTWDAEVRLSQVELGDEAKMAEDMGARPLVILWAGHPEFTAPEDRAKLEAIWSKVAVFSSNSLTQVIDGANHGSINGDEQYAAQVSSAVRAVINSAQSGEPLKP